MQSLHLENVSRVSDVLANPVEKGANLANPVFGSRAGSAKDFDCLLTYIKILGPVANQSRNKTCCDESARWHSGNPIYLNAWYNESTALLDHLFHRTPRIRSAATISSCSIPSTLTTANADSAAPLSDTSITSPCRRFSPYKSIATVAGSGR